MADLESSGVGFERLTEKIEQTNSAAGKLGEMQVREIKVRHRDPSIKVTDVARRDGLSRTTLYKHVVVVAWRHP
ncbi:hypothetical protein PQR08_13385 [Caballeronia jiangsuensis]|uniref:Resolvase HTH domain-containing protein n=1 Tax=Caballeronia jiangsuensis TaxID=1458357 RepID=A0ABW9CJI6_9BURK